MGKCRFMFVYRSFIPLSLHPLKQLCQQSPLSQSQRNSERTKRTLEQLYSTLSPFQEGEGEIVAATASTVQALEAVRNGAGADDSVLVCVNRRLPDG